MTKSRDEEIEDASGAPDDFLHAAMDESEKQFLNPLKIKERRAHILGAVFGFGWQKEEIRQLRIERDHYREALDILVNALKYYGEGDCCESERCYNFNRETALQALEEIAERCKKALAKFE